MSTFLRQPVLWPAIAVMIAVVVSSNILVQYPLNDWLTWGAFTYPVAFLVSDLTNRRHGPVAARHVAWFGFACAVVLSWWLADPRIAMASGSAFITSQLLDIALFHRLRHQRWWRAPLIGPVLASCADTAVFFALAFAGTTMPWITLALGDLAFKLAMALLLLAPFRLLMNRVADGVRQPV